MVAAAFLAAKVTQNRFRFSLRSLLLTTTLVALALGLLVYAIS
jgi:hypothetical protein